MARRLSAFYPHSATSAGSRKISRFLAIRCCFVIVNAADYDGLGQGIVVRALRGETARRNSLSHGARAREGPP